jgi:hypothetical protein
MLSNMSRNKRAAAGFGKSARVGKSIVRNASKNMEKIMVSHAKALYENPFLVLPEYQDSESTKRFKKIRRQLEKVNDIKDDINKLEKRAKKRSLDAAVAGTLLIAHSKKAPFLAIAKLSFGSVYYAQRGHASKEYLIAAQHTNDPFYRLLGIRDIAFKYHLHVYSWDNGFISTGLKANPPKEFIEYITSTLDYSKSNNIIHCSHLSPKEIKEKTSKKQPYLHLYWHSADVHIGICQQCASKQNNTLFSITKYILADDLNEDFDVSVIGSILKDKSSEFNKETLFTDDYLAGQLSDYNFIDKNMKNRRDTLKDKDQQVYIINGKQYDKVDEFISALNPNSYEKHALQKMFSLYQKPVIVSDVSPNDVLELYWDQYGKDIINDITNDENLTEDIISLSESPSIMVKTAFEIKNKQKVLDDLPIYTSLPDIALYADKLARIYRVEGKQKLFSALRSLPDHPKKRSIAYGMLLVINKQSDMKWKFSKIDIESGEFIKPYIETLLDGNPTEYHTSLQQVLNACGFSESLDKYMKS